MVRLADEVAEGTRKLEAALSKLRTSQQEAERASRVKSSFLRMMSHELKTPLAAIQLHLHILERDAGDNLSSSMRQSVMRIGRSNHRLLNLIDTCIEWARVESGRCRPECESFDFCTVVTSVAESFSSLAEEKAIQLEILSTGTTPFLVSDRRIVQLLVLNLVGYAVQNTTRGTVRIVLKSTVGVQHLSVSDGAPPIPIDKREAILSPLQADDGPRSMAGSGSGLGLHVIRDIARAIGGDVELRVVEETGNTFVLVLPDLSPCEIGDGVKEGAICSKVPTERIAQAAGQSRVSAKFA
ncbi:MAG: HAMP domain-containing sensor histidine kinase [Myxococcota bacterium]